jgi:signal transduction histidine kinase
MAEGIRTKQAHSVEAMREFAARQEAVVGAERVRIARELHDVLAHSLSQINVQASVGLHLMEKDHQKAAEALSNIKESSKAALDEVRSVLGALRADSGESQGAPLVPEPQLSRLTALISPLSLQGIEVEIVDELSVPHHSARAAANTAHTANTAHAANTPHAAHTGPELPQAVQLAIFRIVQESLTNVARHSHASTVRVTLSRSEGDYFVQIVDNGTGSGGATGGVADSGGRGVLGMRERAELLGGTLQAGVNPAGGFEVIARIPERVAAS